MSRRGEREWTFLSISEGANDHWIKDGKSDFFFFIEAEQIVEPKGVLALGLAGGEREGRIDCSGSSNWKQYF